MRLRSDVAPIQHLAAHCNVIVWTMLVSPFEFGVLRRIGAIGNLFVSKQYLAISNNVIARKT